MKSGGKEWGGGEMGQGLVIVFAVSRQCRSKGPTVIKGGVGDHRELKQEKKIITRPLLK
jgi:hypothetical protein